MLDEQMNTVLCHSIYEMKKTKPEVLLAIGPLTFA